MEERVMNRRKEISLMAAGLLAGIAVSGPATQAAPTEFPLIPDAGVKRNLIAAGCGKGATVRFAHLGHGSYLVVPPGRPVHPPGGILHQRKQLRQAPGHRTGGKLRRDLRRRQKHRHHPPE